MKKIQWLGLGMILLCFSCANTAGVQPTRDTSPSLLPQSAEEPEASDRGCAYFYYLWGKSAENGQRYEEALQAYEKMLVCDPATGQAGREIAMLLLKMNRPQEAAQRLEKIVAANQTDLQNRQLLARVYTSTGELEKAAGIYQELLAIKEEPQTLLMLASIHAQQRHYDQAQQILERMIKLDPDSYMGYYYLARIYREVGLTEKALTFYDKAQAISWSTRLAAEIAEFYEQQGENAKAIEIYERILDEDETEERARTRLISLFLKGEETDRAIEELRKLPVFAADPDQVNLAISRILLSRQRHVEADGILNGMLAKDPHQSEAGYLLALSYYQQNQIARAIEQIQMITPESDPYEEGIQLWVRILRSDKRFEEAVRVLAEKISSEATRKMSFYVMLAGLHRELASTRPRRCTWNL
jgi:tetratricopeptide (TPR) repeat protein